MRCDEIIKVALEKGYWKTGGKTPGATLYAALIRHVVNKGDASRFKKVGPGQFTLAK